MNWNRAYSNFGTEADTRPWLISTRLIADDNFRSSHMSETGKTLSRGVSFTCHESGTWSCPWGRYIWSAARASWRTVITLLKKKDCYLICTDYNSIWVTFLSCPHSATSIIRGKKCTLSIGRSHCGGPGFWFNKIIKLARLITGHHASGWCCMDDSRTGAR